MLVDLEPESIADSDLAVTEVAPEGVVLTWAVALVSTASVCAVKVGPK